MGISIEAFWLHATCALLFQLSAMVCLRAGRPYVGWVLQFGAAHGALLAGLRSERLGVLLVAAALYAPLVVIPARRLEGRGLWALVGLAAVSSVTVLGWFVTVADDATTRGRPVVQDRWASSSALRHTGQTVVLKPQKLRGRIQDWGADVCFDWLVPGGAQNIELVLENAGDAAAWEVGEGSATIEGGDRSRIRVTMSFPPRGGSVRLRRRDPAGATRVLVVGGLRGDLEAVDALVSRVAADPPDGIVVLGDMIAPKDHRGLLGLRDRLDELGSCVLYVPGVAERAEEDGAGWSALFEGGLGANRVARLGGLTAVLLDTSRGSVGVDGLAAISLRRLLGGAMAGVPIVFSHRALAAPVGREASLVADAGLRAAILDKAEEWGAGFAVSTTEGERFDIERDGVRYLATGIADDRVDAVILTIEHGAVTDVRWLTVPRDGEDGARGFWLRWRGFAEEHIALAEWLTYGLGAGWGALLAALGFLFRRKASIP